MSKTGCGATTNRWHGTFGDGHNNYVRPLTRSRNSKLPVGSRPVLLNSTNSFPCGPRSVDQGGIDHGSINSSDFLFANMPDL